MSRHLSLALLVLGCALRAYWALLNGLSLDEITSLAYVAEPTWASVFWDNAPPTFYVFGKLLSGAGEIALRTYALLVSLASLLILMKWLERSNAEVGTRIFWALNPVSIVNANFRPTVLAEFCGILLFIAVERALRGQDAKRKSLATIGASAAALSASSYLGPLGWFVAAARLRSKFSLRMQALLALIILAIALVEVTYIRTDSLMWLRGTDLPKALLSSLRGASQFFGYSLPLLIGLVAFAIHRRLLDATFLAFGLVTVVMPSIFGYQFEQARFLIFLNPFALLFVDRVLKVRPGAEWRVLAVLAVSTYILSWFVSHEKSAWKEAIRSLRDESRIVYAVAPWPAAKYLGVAALENRFAPNFELECPKGCWVLTSRYNAWPVLEEKALGADFREFSVAEKREYGERCLDRVFAFRLEPKDRP